MTDIVNVNGVKTHVTEPEKFKGVDFKSWQQKMLFYWTTLNLAHVVKEEVPVAIENLIPAAKLNAIDVWKHSEFLCRNYILSSLDDTLYDVYSSYRTAKELWESLQKKYRIEVAGTKKFVIGKFLNYKMIDSKSVVNQVEELQIIMHELHNENMIMNENFQVGSIIEKLPPSWNDFKIYLKHKKSDMTLDDLVLKLRVEQDHRINAKVDSVSSEAKANIVEGRASARKPKDNSQKNKGKSYSNKLASNNKKFKKIKGSCWVCEKVGHKAQDCRHKKDGASAKSANNQANVIEDVLAAVESETNMVLDTKDWWIDTGATKHICGDKSMFST
ncbi:unnamed protein product [Prunus brigantina]